MSRRVKDEQFEFQNLSSLQLNKSVNRDANRINGKLASVGD